MKHHGCLKKIIKEGKYRDELQKKAVISGLLQDHNNYKKQRNKVNRMCRNAKRLKFKNDCENCKGDCKKMWKVVNKVTEKKTKSNTYPSFIETRNADGDLVKIKDKVDIANAMNRQFTEMGSKLASKLPQTQAKFSDYLNAPSKTSMFLKEATDLEVGNHFSEIDINKGVGIDETPPKILKWGEEVLIPIVTKIFNKCIATGIYPDSLKIARVIRCHSNI